MKELFLLCLFSCSLISLNNFQAPPVDNLDKNFDTLNTNSTNNTILNLNNVENILIFASFSNNNDNFSTNTIRRKYLIEEKNFSDIIEIISKLELKVESQTSKEKFVFQLEDDKSKSMMITLTNTDGSEVHIGCAESGEYYINGHYYHDIKVTQNIITNVFELLEKS